MRARCDVQCRHLSDQPSLAGTMTPVPQLIQSGIWRRTNGVGLERFELLRTTNDWVLRGTIITLAEHKPAAAIYEVLCDDSWHTKRADISLRDGTGERCLRITAAGGGEWHENGKGNEAIRGCVDVDLEWSPATNTIPVRRLRLPVGQKSGVVTAAWVRFPDLTLQPLRQEYERTSERRFRYSSGGGAFVAEIVVDSEGLVLDYEGFWQRVAETHAC
jgi:hypothetical protein